MSKTCLLSQITPTHASSSSSFGLSLFINCAPSKSCHWPASWSFLLKRMLTGPEFQGYSHNVNIHGRKPTYLYERGPIVRRRRCHFRPISQSGMHIRCRCHTRTTLTQRLPSNHTRVCTTLTSPLSSLVTFSRGRLQMESLPQPSFHPLSTHSINHNSNTDLTNMAMSVAGNSLRQFHLAARLYRRQTSHLSTPLSTIHHQDNLSSAMAPSSAAASHQRPLSCDITYHQEKARCSQPHFPTASGRRSTCIPARP